MPEEIKAYEIQDYLRSLAEHAAEKFPAAPVRHIGQRCLYRLIMPDEADA